MNKKSKYCHLPNVFLAFLLGMLLLGSNMALANQNILSPLGINTNEALEVDSSIPFVDLFRLALPFDEARPWFTKGNIRYDRNGWPMQLNRGQAGTRFLSHIPPAALPKGNYTVLYDGQGEMTYGASAKLVKRLPGKDVIRFEPMKNGLLTATLLIKKSTPGNYLRNIRILMPGGVCRNKPFQQVRNPKQCPNNSFMSFEKHHKQLIFNPQYLTFMRDFKVIRFMNMSGVTRNNIRSWNQRPTLQKSTWGGKEGVRGVPIEVMVQLANTLNANPWFNIPHKADDGYINNYARYVKRHLKPHLKVYLEYSNETWNDVFVPQAEHMKQMGVARRLDKDRRVAGAKFYSMQSVHIFKIWERAFGNNQRLMRVMGGLATNLQLSHTILGYKNAYKSVDALAIAPYFHINQSQMGGVRSVQRVFQLLNDDKNRYSINNTLKAAKEQAQIAQSYGVQLVAYEGGQHLVHSKTHSLKEGANPYLVKANKHPMMGQAYQRLLNGWKLAGGNLFVAFSAPRPSTWHGSWGVKEYINEPNHLAPKYAALMSFKRANRCWWKGCTSPTVARLKKPSKIAAHLATGNPAIPKTPNIVTIRKTERSKGQRISTVINGTINDPRDLSAVWYSSWDDDNLYVWVNVQDDRHIKDSSKPWADDSVEIYIDADASRSATYDGKNDFQLTYRMHDKQLSVGGNSASRNMRGVKQEMVKKADGYHLKTAIPWQALNVKPAAGRRVGFDVQINDDDTGNSRDAKLSWNANVDKAWKNPQMFGQLVLH
ncbi:MAG: cellulose-binding domain protein [uncultured Thiotrichaceae bacterium]|uniref:Cellulose-binding domain protein n=1 Tax=uncultured Thiotrichaceae bacterium TaxID=298394 RepID=A0A6S6THB7_9GAMM|nr:MAG: cellulose-binding domain protein [uncultured Thiotrichaceae bacterium]